MSISLELFDTYCSLYEETTDEMWDIIASNSGYSVEALKDLFAPKENEVDVLATHVNEVIETYPLLRQFIDRLNEENISLIDRDVVREAFEHIMERIDREMIQEILEMDEDEEFYVSLELCDAFFMIMAEVLTTIL